MKISEAKLDEWWPRCLCIKVPSAFNFRSIMQLEPAEFTSLNSWSIKAVKLSSSWKSVTSSTQKCTLDVTFVVPLWLSAEPARLLSVKPQPRYYTVWTAKNYPHVAIIPVDILLTQQKLQNSESQPHRIIRLGGISRAPLFQPPTGRKVD